MKTVSSINDVAGIEKIRVHLKLWQAEHPGKPPQEHIYGDMIDYQPFDDILGT